MERDRAGVISRPIEAWLVICCTLTCLLIAVYFFWSEKINWGGGFGMDGQWYGAVAIDPFNQPSVANPKGPAQARRGVLPSIIVHFSLKAIDVVPSVPTVIRGFIVFNVFALFGTLLIWTRIAKRVGMSVQGALLGGCALVVNFASLKWLGYYPVLTDSAALLIGMGAAYLFIRSWPLLLLLLGVASWFVWPTGPYFCLLLGLLCPAPTRSLALSDRSRTNIRLVGSAAVAVVIVVLGFIQTGSFVLEFTKAPRLLLYLGLTAATVAWATWIALSFVDSVPRPIILIRRALWALPLITFVYFANQLFPSIGFASIYSQAQVVAIWVYLASERPLAFIVSHVTFFGPIFLLALMHWRDVCRVASQFGTGGIIVLICILIAGLDSESRHLFMYYPLIVLFVCLALDKTVHAEFLAVFLMISIVMSKVWLDIGEIKTGDPHTIPDAYFYMNLGPWMQDQFYGFHLGIALIAAYAVEKSLRGYSIRRASPAKQHRHKLGNEVIMFPYTYTD